MDELPGREQYAPRDGKCPATEEQWYCPSCGRIAKAFVAFRRVIACIVCQTTFEANVRKINHDPNVDLYETARLDAEQEQHPYWNSWKG